MRSHLERCPQCERGRLSANEYQVRCDRCEWVVLDPDPLYLEYVEKAGWENVSSDELILEPFHELPDDFGALLTTTRGSLPPGHPVNNPNRFVMTGAEFRMRRDELGLSAEWLADRLGVALKTVQRWENGHRPIPEGIAHELLTAWYARRGIAAQRCAEHLHNTADAVMMIPRTGTYLGFPASWYRALVDQVREVLAEEYEDAVSFNVVYFDEVEDQK